MLNGELIGVDALSGKIQREVISVGGEGGTSNYDKLTNKPKINGVELKGDKTSRELGIPDGTEILLGADGIIERNRIIFTVQDGESFMEYRKNQMEFFIDGLLPVVGTLDDSLLVAISFGDTVYNVYSSLDATTPMNLGELKSASTYSDEIGYRFFFKALFMQTADVVGFVVSPSVVKGVDLSEYVKFTDTVGRQYDSIAGLVVMGMNSVAPIYAKQNGTIDLGNNNTRILNKNNTNAIRNMDLDYAIKVGMTTNKEQWNEEEKASARTLIGAVGKVSDATTYPQVYSKDKDGNQTMVDATASVVGDTIVKRNLNGQIIVSRTPLYDTDAASKGYVDSKFNGANKAVSFVNYSAMISSLNTLPNTSYSVGQNIMIITLAVPDLWVSEIAEESVAYTYVSDDDFVNELNANGSVQVGYFKLSALETQKVDLTEYVKNTDYASRTNYGLVKGGGSTYGVAINNGIPEIIPAIETIIDAKTNKQHPITPYYLDYAVAKSITTNTIELADEQKAAAQTWLGIESSLNAHKQIILGADGVFEGNVYNFTVSDTESYLPYRTNGTKFLVDLHLPISGDLDTSKEVAITFGDTVYYVYNILKGQEHSTIGDLRQVDKYHNETGYRFITEMTFFDNSEFKGFAIIPTISMSDILSLDSDQMDNYIAEGGLTQGQLAICKKVITNGYTEGGLYRFDITYPDTYAWTELSGSSSTPKTNTLLLTGTNVLTSLQTFKNHVQIMVEFETDGIHAGFDCVLHPYDEAVCFVTYDILVNGTPNFGTAYLDDSGHVVINVPNGLTFTNVHAKYLSYGVGVEATLLEDGSYSLKINTEV